jgi:hypothetical protein
MLRDLRHYIDIDCDIIENFKSKCLSYITNIIKEICEILLTYE